MAHVHEARLPQPHVSDGEMGVTQPARRRGKKPASSQSPESTPSQRVVCPCPPAFGPLPGQSRPSLDVPRSSPPRQLPGAASPHPAPTSGICQDGASTRSAETCSAEAQARGGDMQLVCLPGSRPRHGCCRKSSPSTSVHGPHMAPAQTCLEIPQTVRE